MHRLWALLALAVLFACVALPSPALAQATGVLEVETDSDGAFVLLDGEPLGATPLLEIVPAGRHTVTISRPGFADHVEDVVIEADATLQLRATLKRIAPALKVTVDVESAVVKLDGNPVGTGRVVVVDPAEPGRHELTVEADGYGQWTANVTLKPGVETPVDVSLRGSLGSLTVTSNTADANVFLDGAPKGVVPATIDPLPPGPHGLRVTADGLSTVLLAVVIEPGRKSSLDIALVKEAGAIDVRPTEATARIAINGVDVGTGRVLVEGLKPGSYSVRATAAGHTDFVGTALVEAGETASVHAKLEAFGSDRRLASRQGDAMPVARRPGFWAALGGGVGAGVAVAVIAAVVGTRDPGAEPDPGLAIPATDVALTLP